jgi:hypothetical protein
MMDQPLDNEGLIHLRAVNFDWVMHIKSIWSDAGVDLDSIQHTHRTTVATELYQLRNRGDTNSPLGLVILGQAGSGKTHLLNVTRKYSLLQGIGFILVDMTGVHDFWGTVLQGYVSSLQVDVAGGETQLGQLLDYILTYTDQKIDRRALAQATGPELNQYLKLTLTGLTIRHRTATIRYQNVVRALFLLNSNDLDFSSAGSNWLQGLEIDERARSGFGFTVSIPGSVQNIVEGISWAMSLRGPAVLAFDQLDSIVMQHHLTAGTRALDDLLDEQRISRAIIQGIGGGLTALHTATSRTLTVVSCLSR